MVTLQKEHVVASLSLRVTYAMITSQRSTAILFLQVICLLLLALGRFDHVAQLFPCDGAAADVQLSQQSGDTVIECADVDEDTVDGDHVSKPEYANPSNALVQQIASQGGRLYPVEQDCHLPLVCLPVFSPPKITV